MKEEIQELVRVVEEISKGNYSNDLFSFVKPDTPDYLKQLVESIGMMMVKIEARELKLEYLIEELKVLNDKIKRNAIDTVSTISKALGARDTYTKGHAERVSVYAARLAERLKLDDKLTDEIKLAGILHDIGKINFSDKIFSNVDINLSKDMFDEIQKHPETGYNILKDLEFLGNAVNFVYYHHERMDGKGYPVGLSSDNIPLGAKILSVCDCFDAITSDRSYQKGKSAEEAYDILRKISGMQLDGLLVEEFIREVQENGMT